MAYEDNENTSSSGKTLSEISMGIRNASDKLAAPEEIATDEESKDEDKGSDPENPVEEEPSYPEPKKKSPAELRGNPDDMLPEEIDHNLFQQMGAQEAIEKSPMQYGKDALAADGDHGEERSKSVTAPKTMSALMALIFIFCSTLYGAVAILTEGELDVASAATPQCLSATNLYARVVVVQAKAGNTMSVVIGGADLSNGDPGVELSPGAAVSYDGQAGSASFNLKNICVDAGVNGEGVSFQYYM